MRKQIEIRLVIEIETNDAEVVDVTVVGPPPSVLSAPLDEGVPTAVQEMIDQYAPPTLAPFEMEFANRLVELGLDLQPPSGARRKEYVNAFPPKRYGSKRAAAFAMKSGRVEIYCHPNNAKKFKNAEVVSNNGEPFAVKVYLRSDAAIDDAVELTRIGLDERSA